MTADVPSLYLHWEETLGDLLDRTRLFPKAVRFTFAARIDGYGLDVLEGIVDARYSRGDSKADALRRIDLTLARLRALLRLAHARRYLDHRAFERVMRGVDTAGRMVGGWRKSQESR